LGVLNYKNRGYSPLMLNFAMRPWNGFGLRFRAGPISLLLALFSLTAQSQPAPLTRAHAHNDYLHQRPLLDALSHGFSSVEADIHIIKGQLLVAHDEEKAWPTNTLQALYLDLKDLHGNTVDGMHVASAGGVWSTLAFGFGGLRDRNGCLSFDPRLPAAWPSLRFSVTWRGSRLRVALTQDELTITVERVGEPEVSLVVRGEEYVVTQDSPLRVPLAHQGPRIDGLLGDKPILGGTRSDGTKITAGVPEPIAFDELAQEEADYFAVAPAPPHVPGV